MAETQSKTGPLTISGNSNLLSQAVANGWTGSGTASDPIVITDLSIDISRSSSFTPVLIEQISLHLIIDNLRLAGDYSGDIESVAEGVHVSNSSNLVIRNSEIRGFLFFGISITNSKNVTVRNTMVHEPIVTKDDSGDSQGIASYGSSNVRIIENSIEGTKIGIEIIHSLSCSIRGNTVTSTWSGIDIQVHSGGVEVMKNNLYGSGFTIYAGDWDIQLDGNNVNSLPLLFVRNTNDREFSGDYGQILLVNVSDIRITDVEITKATVGIGIINSTAVDVRGCILSENRLAGISMSNVTYSKVEGNTISGSEAGLSMVDVNLNNQVVYNTFDGNKVGIAMYSTDYGYGLSIRENRFAHNIFSGNSQYMSIGPYLQEDSLIAANTFINSTIIQDEFHTTFDGYMDPTDLTDQSSVAFAYHISFAMIIALPLLRRHLHVL